METSVPNISLGVTVSIPGLLCVVSPYCSLGSTFTSCFHLHSQAGHRYSPFSFPITLLTAAPHNRHLTPISLYDFQFLLLFYYAVLNLPSHCKSSLHSRPPGLPSRSCLHIPPPSHYCAISTLPFSQSLHCRISLYKA